MRKSSFTEEQIIGILKKHEAGAKREDLCLRHGISGTTFYKLKAKYGGLDVSEARKLRALEDENRRLKKLLADTRTEISGDRARFRGAHRLERRGDQARSPGSVLALELVAACAQPAGAVRRLADLEPLRSAGIVRREPPTLGDHAI